MFTPQTQRHCFNVRLIDDTVYEATQEFFVNLTTTEENISLSPNFIVISVNDDDGEFEWESEKVTAWMQNERDRTSLYFLTREAHCMLYYCVK